MQIDLHRKIVLKEMIRRVALVSQELSNLPEHMCLLPVISGAHVTLSFD